MMTLLTQMLEAQTCREVDRIIEQNIFKVDASARAFLCQFANKSKRRITRIEREKKKSWSDILN